MTVIEVALLVSSALYAGFQWTIRLLVYPQFANVPDAEFAAYEREHRRRVSIVVAPLFASVAVSSIAAVITRPGVASVVAAVSFVFLLITTWLGAVPMHRRLTSAYDAAAHRRLIRVDTVRLVLAVVIVLAAIAFVLPD